LICIAVALGSREFDFGWLLPVPAWVATTAWTFGSPLKIAVALAIYGATLVWAVRKLRRSREHSFELALVRMPQPAVK
jgi:hypothetical protein